MRKHRLIECNPEFLETSDAHYLVFACPEGHDNCRHVVPFAPGMDGVSRPSPQNNGAIWQRTGDTFETITLSPSIRRVPRYADRAAALAAGCLEQYLEPPLFCALHIFIRDGGIVFCEDSR